MFTGIIEEIGEVKYIKKGINSSRLLIKAKKVLENTKIGDSVSTNGVCLTVTNISNDNFEADVMSETLRRSNLGGLKIGSKVNLERALTLEKRLGGHIVSGHIDGTSKIISFFREDNAIWITLKADKNILKYIIFKGSVTIDGVSLTVAYVDDEIFKISIIPHTGSETNLLSKNINETVNIECDLIGKYVEKLLGLNQISNEKKANQISEELLINTGLI